MDRPLSLHVASVGPPGRETGSLSLTSGTGPTSLRPSISDLLVQLLEALCPAGTQLGAGGCLPEAG